MKKKILIFYDYFLPGYKAGGPVQSLANMITLLQHEFDFFVITSAYDVNENKPYDDIVLNDWNDLNINEVMVKVWYAEKKCSNKKIGLAIQTVHADFIFMNCMYSIPFFLYPILFLKKIFPVHQPKVVISPRGILQSGSLAVKSFKKKIYLFLLQLSGVLKRFEWHASSSDEAAAIYQHFGKHCKVNVLSNVPKHPIAFVQPSNKKENELHLVHLSLIAPVKNILTLLYSLKETIAKIHIDIYGPVKDESYWQACLKEMQELPSNIQINYKGDVEPNKVQDTLQQYDASILLTKGENFGHALFESLSVGRPIITSFFTPWNNLQEQYAGWNVDISNKKLIADLLDDLATKSNEEWKLYCDGAHALAVKYFEEADFLNGYRRMFR